MPKGYDSGDLETRVPTQKMKALEGDIIKMGRRGYSLRAVANSLGLSFEDVAFMWKRYLKYPEMTGDDANRIMIHAKLEEYSEIKREAWAAWEKSKSDRVTLTDESSTRDSKSKEVREGQCGDPRYLMIIKQCIDEERHLLSLNPSMEVNVNTVIKWDELYKTADAILNRQNPIDVQLQGMRKALGVKKQADSSNEDGLIEGVVIGSRTVIVTDPEEDSVREGSSKNTRKRKGKSS